VDIEDAYDLILVSTDHEEYKTFDFRGYSCPLVDSRNCIQNKPVKYFRA
jgi:UDP-N-acetyl-D-mannosaminuronate dehydrogenase